MTNPISVLTVLGALLISSVFPILQASRPISSTQYCNKRFGYCLNYPASLLPDRYVSLHSDSLLLKSIGQIADVTVIGKLEGTKSTPQEVFAKNTKSIELTNGKANVISTLFGEDFYEANFMAGSFTYHQKANFTESRSVLLTIKVPVNRPELMVRLKEDVGIVFE